jgi:hypothetical protein
MEAAQHNSVAPIHLRVISAACCGGFAWECRNYGYCKRRGNDDSRRLSISTASHTYWLDHLADADHVRVCL